jgi:hypothetical protein
MGLRSKGNALDKKDWDSMPSFKKICCEFLVFQIETLQPKLIVVMGPNPKSTLDSLAAGDIIASAKFQIMRFGKCKSAVLYSTHPYGDFNFDEARKVRDGLELRDAWSFAQQV